MENKYDKCFASWSLDFSVWEESQVKEELKKEIAVHQEYIKIACEWLDCKDKIKALYQNEIQQIQASFISMDKCLKKETDHDKYRKPNVELLNDLILLENI